MHVRLRLLAVALVLLLLPSPAVPAQAVEPLTLVGIERSGDALSVTIRANAGIHHVLLRLTESGAIAGLPNWEPGTMTAGQVASWNFTLLRDIDAASIDWEATVWGDPPQSGSIPVLVPEESFAEPLTLIALARSGGTLLVTMRANENLTSAVIRLEAAGAIVGLPEWQRVNWSREERSDWNYQLLREVDRATLAWEIERPGRPAHVGSMEVSIPAAVAPGESAARLVITGAGLRGGTQAFVNVTNYGGLAARDVVVSIEDASMRRIGFPLTRVLGTVAPGGQAVAEFTLPEGTRDVVIALDAANGTTRTPVALRDLGAIGEGGASGDVNVTLSTDLPFREVDLGRSADYAVQVRNEGAPSLVQLRVDGLPPGYSARFFVGGSAVPSLYLDRNQTRQATLTVTVPSSNDEVDRTVDFQVLASVNGTEARRLAMGVAVRGVGQLDVASSEGEAGIPPGGTATFQVVVRNTGSAPIFDVELDSRRPYGWTVRTEPRRIDRVEPGGSSMMNVEVRAPDVIGGGRYTVDVAARSADTTSRYTPLALNVEEAEQGGGWVWVALLLVIGGILGGAAWWKRRG